MKKSNLEVPCKRNRFGYWNSCKRLPNFINVAALVECDLQLNLDYSKCQGPQESFRIIGSSNDRNREFSDIFGKLGCFHRTSLFASLTVFREAIRTSVKALKKMSSLEGVLIVSYALQV